MSFVTAAMIAGGATLASSLIGSRAAGKAADVQAQAAEQGTAAQERMFNKQVELQEPWRQAGVNALNKLQGLADYKLFDNNAFTRDPGYGFRLAEGQKALDRQAAARGGLISGGALKAAQRYGQDMGSQEYQNAFNRYQIERNATLGPWQSLAGVGQTATNTLTNAAGNFGANQAANLSNSAQARASGYIGSANAFAGGLGQYLNYSQGQNMVNALQNRGTSPYAMSGDYSVSPNYTLGGSLNNPG
jgi:hypothetical protein